MTKKGKKNGGELSQAAVAPQQPSQPRHQQQEAAVVGSAVGLPGALPVAARLFGAKVQYTQYGLQGF